MNKSDITNFHSRCANMKFIPCDLTDDGRIRFRAVYKRKIHLASFLCDQNTGHVDEIHFAKKDCNTNDRIIKAIAICLDNGEWDIDINTKQYFSIRYSKFNKKLGKYEKFYSLEQISVFN